MSVQVKRRREAASFLSTFVGAQAELIVDTTNNRVQVHDGATAGGWPAAKLSEVVTNTRTAVSDAAYAALASDRTIAYTGITAARVVTLPAASAYPTGTALTIVDEAGACSATNTITLMRVGSDTIDGAASAVIACAYGYLALQSNGSNKWTIVDQAASNLAAVGIGTAADPNNQLSVYGTSALFNSAGNFNFTINKAASTNTASTIYEDGFSGRAQVGLCGDDNFHFKVSPDGSTWYDALDITNSSGVVTASFGICLSSGITQSELSQRSAVTNQPVPTFRPTTTNMPIAVDIMPNGTATPIYNDYISWIDICDADVFNNTSTALNKLGLRTRSSVIEIGSDTLYGGSGKPLVFSYQAGEIFRINGTGMGIGGVASFVAPFTLSKNVTAPLTNYNEGTPLAHFAAADGTKPIVLIDAYGQKPMQGFRRTDGTAASPTAIVSGDVLGQFQFGGYNGSSYYDFAAGMYAVATQNWSPTAEGASFVFYTTKNNTTSVATAMVIDNTGYIGVGTSTPSCSVDVNGLVRTASYTVATLPAASAALAGARACVTDALSPTFLATLTGGGSVVSPAFCNGSAWVAG